MWSSQNVFPNRNDTVLLGDDHFGHGLPRIFLRTPLLPSILNMLIFEILQEPNPKEILRVTLEIKLLQPITQDMIRVRIGLDFLLVELLLSLG
jgi:hypothetical protein